MSRGAAVRRREIDVVSVDLFPNLLGVARRSVAVEVTQVTVDFVEVPLLKEEKRGGRYRADTKEKKERKRKILTRCTREGPKLESKEGGEKEKSERCGEKGKGKKKCRQGGRKEGKW